MISIEYNDPEVTAALGRLAGLLDDMSPAMSEIGLFLVRTSKARFGSETDPDGNPWAPRSPVTIAHYQRLGISYGGILHQSGQLGGNIFHSFGPDWTRVGSPEPYAGTMQFGAEQGQFGAHIGRTKTSDKRPNSQDYFMLSPWGDIPARPYLGVSEEDHSGILDIIAEQIGNAMGVAL